jgi:hypothetical protein
MKSHEELIHDWGLPSQDWNTGPPEYEGMLTTQPRRSVGQMREEKDYKQRTTTPRECVQAKYEALSTDAPPTRSGWR